MCFVLLASEPENDDVGQSVHPFVCLSVQHFSSELDMSRTAGHIGIIFVIFSLTGSRLLMIFVIPPS